MAAQNKNIRVEKLVGTNSRSFSSPGPRSSLLVLRHSKEASFAATQFTAAHTERASSPEKGRTPPTKLMNQPLSGVYIAQQQRYGPMHTNRED
ncbi:uncharacterized protein RCO7_07619 [Rhynchosporium graminicola]|uniref:Uncharacterized protein n=1 Tax=Rhynchosporium graminicola TaxID=2792576 RepID=A0A1E1KZK3_9HELO|nr:uncharacterized protein RCO7_07619 [Rhynchosporium commune]